MGTERLDPQNTSTKEQIRISESFTEKEKANKNNANLLTTKISTALGTKFDQQNIPFDIGAFKKNLNQSVERVFLNPDIPDIAKEKFKQDILAKIELLTQVTVADIATLQNRRNIESLGIEAMEQSGKTKAQKQAYYLNKILIETIGKYIEPVSTGLIEAFSREKITTNNSELVHKAGFEKFQANIRQLDSTYGFDFTSRIPEMSKWGMNTKKEFEELMRQGIFRESLWLQQMIRNGVVNENTKRTLGKQAEITKNGKTVNLIDAYLAYKNVISSYNSTQSEFYQTRDTALANDVFVHMKNGFGMEQLKSEFDHLTQNNIEEKMKKASLADFVIMATQLAQITPIIGDIGGGALDIGSAVTGITSDGAKLSTLERTFSGIFGTLGITVFAGFLNRARKAGKMAGIISGLRIGTKYLPEKINAFLKAGGKLSEQAKTALSSFGKMMGKESGGRIEQILVKSGDTFPNTKRVLSRQEEQAVGKIPKKRPEEVIKEGKIEQQIVLPESLLNRLKIIQNELNLPISDERIQKNIVSLLKNNSLQDLDGPLIKGLIQALHERDDLDFDVLLRNQSQVRYYHLSEFLELLLNPHAMGSIKDVPMEDLWRFTLVGDFRFNFAFKYLHDREKAHYILDWRKAENHMGKYFGVFIKVIGDFISFSELSLAEKYRKIGVDMVLFEEIERLTSKDYGKYYDEAHDVLKNMRKRLLSQDDTKDLSKNTVEEILKSTIDELSKLLKWDIGEAKELNFVDTNFGHIFTLPERFNPKEGLEYIRKLSGVERVKAMEIWKRRLKEQIDVVSSMPNQVKDMSIGIDFVKSSKIEIMEQLVRRLQSQLERLSAEQRKQVLAGVEKFIDRKMIIHKYMEDPIYKNNPKQLAADALGVDSSKLKGDVMMEVDGANFTFYVHEEDDYKLLKAYGDEEMAKNSLNSGGVSMGWAKIEELKGTITMVNGAKYGDPYATSVKLHETRHADNQIIMPDHHNGDNLSRAKDEIIAYLRDGSNVNRITEYLHKERGQQALYDYYKDIEKVDPERYRKLRELYEQELQSAIQIAKKMQQAQIPNYLDILAITPVRQWGNLEKIYFSGSLTHSQKLFESVKMAFEKVIEVYFAVRDDIVQQLGPNRGNFIFYMPQAIGIEILSIGYLDENYPHWQEDIVSNVNKFLNWVEEQLSSGKVNKYYEQLLKGK